ncbi:MAG TPA: crosslink repair DNA glycosylase YcaQ family protein [Bacteroidota bacterium]|nr:crosslink repair DNA glycosylase YcaQ family protein [Bacteroidota bacterium]
MNPDSVLNDFHPIVREWFTRTFGTPSPPQVLGWPSIASGAHTLILAPTGSGKTLAAFLWAINHLLEQHLRERLSPGVRILYISPLKALNNDIQRNLDGPLDGILKEARSAGLSLRPIRTAVRTGDTPQADRVRMVKSPPDILITTPESLYLMLTSVRSRAIFRTVQYVIVDEIHSVCSNKRGVHLSLSLERLQEIAEGDFIRIGLSATQRPLERVAAFLGGMHWKDGGLQAREVHIIDAGHRKQMDLSVECAVADFSMLVQEGVWDLVFAEVLALIKAHRTTLIFVNNRRLAERAAAQLNQLIVADEPPPAPSLAFNLYAVPREAAWSASGDPVVQAYHGSMSRQAREEMESDLKAGKLRALVATSALELGIDIGSIDLVIQLQSPHGVSRGLQRVGRSGHLVTATSKGRLFPTHREDLVESAVVARAMAAHEVEETLIPENCLDVLAQQIVAMVSVEEREVEALFDCVRQSFCYRNLSKKLYAGVLEMLAGRYTDEAFRELKARISYDKVNGVLRALPGSGRLAITSGGTISDRGYFGVYLPDKTTKVGEVDEEFVYETRVGDTFILGTSVWRVEDIDANRLTVRPAPGEPARMPFWRGEGIGRSFELSLKLGEFRRMLSAALDRPDCLRVLRGHWPIDSRAAWNIQEYFRKQRSATGSIAHDRLIVVEGFRDEIGDPRLVIHSVFGRRVNGLLGLVLSRRLEAQTGTGVQMLYNNDGIMLRSSSAEDLPLTIADGLTSAEAEGSALEELLCSPLFAGQFRQNAARALLMPKTAPGRRTPLWLQRLKAGDLLQVVRRLDDFPIVIETVREVLHEILDFEHFKSVVRDIERGEIALEKVHTELPSPFAASLLLDFVAAYMYEADQSRQEKQSQYLALNREILGEIIELDSASGLIRPEAIEAVERQIQHSAEGTRARSPEELMEVLLRLGDLSEEEVCARAEGDGLAMLRVLAADGRAARIEFADESRWIAGEDLPMYRSLDAEESSRYLIDRYLRSHAPLSTEEIAQHFGASKDRVEEIVRGLARGSEIVKGSFRTSKGSGEQWCYKPTLERIHRQTISILRREITPSSPAEFVRFLLRWQGFGVPEAHDLGSCLAQLQGLPLPSELWERDVLRCRVEGVTTELLTQFVSAGNGLWVGSSSGRLRFISRGSGGIFLQVDPESQRDALRESARRIFDYLIKNGASFFSDIREGAHLSLEAMNGGIAELFWRGFITNDVFAEVMAVKRAPRGDESERIEPVQILNPHHAPARGRLMQSVRRAIRQVPGWMGRWSLVHTKGFMGESASKDEIARAQAIQLLDRYGILAREFHRREELLPWVQIASHLQRMELRGEIRRGYFVEGLSGMQYALPAAIEELRRARSEKPGGEIVLVNACDPANPYGAGFEFASAQSGMEKIPRAPSTYVAFSGGRPLLVFESFGARIRSVGSGDRAEIREALARFVSLLKLPERIRPFKEIVVEYCNDERPSDNVLGDELRALGFIRDSNQTMRRDPYG